MTQHINPYGGSLTTTEDKSASNADITTKVTASKKPIGNHGLGYLVGHFNVPSHLAAGATELPIGVYDLGEVFPDGAYVAGDVLLDVTEAEVGAGDLHVQHEGGTAIAAGTLGKSVITGDFAIGQEVGGLKLQAMVDTGVLTAGAYTVVVPYRISGYSA
jgi:hypothetical protein